MGEAEIARFEILGFIILATLITGIVIFIFELRRRIALNEKEKKEINEQHVQQILSTQLEVQQQTMQYIGREIHDNVGQQLTLASLYIQQIDHEKKYPEINDRIITVSKIINESLSDLRNLSKNLTDDHITKTDLVTLIENETEKIKSVEVCVINFNSTEGSITASYSAKNVVVRIVQEFLQNSLKHSACSIISVEIEKLNNNVSISISDNGKGFLESETRGKGIGLTNMKKRAEAIGASVSIESKLNGGTKMRLLIPADKINS